MKLSFTSLLLLSLIFAGCKKDNYTPPAEPLMGTWELSHSSSFMGPATNYAPGNGNLLKFTAGNQYKRYDDGVLGDSGTFRLSSAKFYNERVNLIKFGDVPTREIFRIVQDTLSVSSYPYDDNGNELMDGGGGTYVRIKE